jgi:hypothetical protein
MKMWKRQLLRFLIFAVLAIGCLLISCSDTQQFVHSTQGTAIIATSETIAKTAVEAAASAYGGPLAGQLAGAGLDALASVLQGYLNRPVPAAIVKASPGIRSVANAVAPLVQSGAPVTQSNVNAVFHAAAIAAQTK